MMLLQPIVPFEPIMVADKPPRGSSWTAQVKWDGVRILTYYDGEHVRIFNRKLNERTLQYPELTDIKRYCSASSVVFDGEVIALEKGKPSFHNVMKRDSIRQSDRVKQGQRETPVVYMIFDMLFLNGTWITGKALAQRQELLKETVFPQDDIQLVENFEDADTLFNIIKVQDMEGIVYKDLTSAYLIKGKDKRWQKRKNYRELAAVIGGVTLRGGVVNALLLGLYDSAGQLRYVGHAGTGKLTAADWRNLTNQLAPLVVSKIPFVHKPERVKDVLWIKPMITVKIKFIEWTEGHNLRQPSIQAVLDTAPEECVFDR